MTEQPRIPDLETRTRNIARWREACLMLDGVTLKLDESIARVESENRRNPRSLHRLQKAQKLFDDLQQQ